VPAPAPAPAPTARPRAVPPLPALPPPLPNLPPAPAAPPAPQATAPSAGGVAPAPGPPAGPGPGAAKEGGIEIAGTGVGVSGSALGSYLALVDWKIESHWVPLGAGSTVPIVRFRVLRSGQVRDIEVEQSSGDGAVDSSALRAIRQSLPLPPFPNLVTESYLDLRYRFLAERR
jgi:TonB family protein